MINYWFSEALDAYKQRNNLSPKEEYANHELNTLAIKQYWNYGPDVRNALNTVETNTV